MWTKDDWKKVAFGDEKKFMLRFNQRHRVRRPRGQRFQLKYLKPTVKSDKKINVFGAFGYFDVGPFIQIKDTLTAKKYHNILSRYMVPSLMKMTHCKDPYYHQDNDPKHTSKLCTNYLLNKKINVTGPPPQSPDLNPIENLWHYMEVMCEERTSSNETELFNTVKTAWNNIPKNYIQRLVESMPQRIEAVIEAKGGATRY
jgi:hypothetical protein